MSYHTDCGRVNVGDVGEMRPHGMDPWFEFWEKVKYAIDQTWIEWQNSQAYRRNM